MSSATLTQSSTWYNPKLDSTRKRHQIVLNKVNELMNIRVKGMRPNFEDVIHRASEETGLAPRTIENIISRNKKGA